MEKNLMYNIQNSRDSMQKSNKKIADYIMKNYKDAAFLTLDENANIIGVSTTTIIRFAKTLGLSGYTELQKCMQQLLLNDVGLTERLGTPSTNESFENMIEATIKSDIKLISNTLHSIDEDVLNLALTNIATSEYVYILGMRASFGIAHHLSVILRQMRKNVILITSLGDTIPEEIINVTSNDVLIVLAFSRYPRSTIETAKWFKKQNAKIIAITDNPLSPVAMLTDEYFICEIKRVGIKNSMIAPISFINFLVNNLKSHIANLREHAQKHNDYTVDNNYFN